MKNTMPESQKEAEERIAEVERELEKQFGKFYAGVITVGYRQKENGFPMSSHTLALGLDKTPTSFGVGALKVIALVLQQLLGAAPPLNQRKADEISSQ